MIHVSSLTTFFQLEHGVASICTQYWSRGSVVHEIPSTTSKKPTDPRTQDREVPDRRKLIKGTKSSRATTATYMIKKIQEKGGPSV
jgi:hypothetical protein